MRRSSHLAKESSITRAIIEWLNGLPETWATKLHGGRYQAAGLPDVLCVHRGHAVLLEVKRPGERPTALQEHMHAKLRAAGARVGVVTSRREAEEILALVATGSRAREGLQVKS